MVVVAKRGVVAAVLLPIIPLALVAAAMMQVYNDAKLQDSRWQVLFYVAAFAFSPIAIFHTARFYLMAIKLKRVAAYIDGGMLFIVDSRLRALNISAISAVSVKWFAAHFEVRGGKSCSMSLLGLVGGAGAAMDVIAQHLGGGVEFRN